MEFTFGKEDRLCSRKDIETLILKGHCSFVYPFKFYWNIVDIQNQPVKIAFAVPKKRFKHANKRNLIKRRMREAFRMQKPFFSSELVKLNLKLQLLTVYVSNDIMNFNEIDKKIKILLDNIKNDIQKPVM